MPFTIRSNFMFRVNKDLVFAVLILHLKFQSVGKNMDTRPEYNRFVFARLAVHAALNLGLTKELLFVNLPPTP